MTAFIVDNSVWWKAARFPAMRQRLRDVAAQDLILACPPQVLEYCFSARDADEHAALREDMAQWLPAEEHPGIGDVLAIQTALWAGGYVRGAGTVDVQIAAYAMANAAVVLTADHDFDHIAAVVPSFAHEYLPEA